MDDVLGKTWRLLTFRITRDELLALDHRHLGFGLVCTWLVGMGRYWDDPNAPLLQHLGVGSIIYVFALALLLFLVVWPFRPPDWSFMRLLTFITLVSPPAALYALPVERWVGLPTAAALNGWFLGIVALWRVALMFFYMKRFARLPVLSTAIAGLLPLAAIVTALFLLNLQHVTFDIMGGFREPSAHDTAYSIVAFLSLISYFAFIPLLATYGILVTQAWLQRRRQRQAALLAAVQAAGEGKGRDDADSGRSMTA